MNIWVQDAENLLFQTMRQCGVRPDTNNFNSLIEALARNKLLDRAEEILDLMKKWNVAPDAKTFTTLLSFCLEFGEGQRGQRIVARMKKANVQLDQLAKQKLRKLNRLISSSPTRK